LEKARQAGLAIPEFYISNGFFETPVIVDPINPFTLRGRVALKQTRAKSVGKSLTRNYTYAICCQELPPGSRVGYFRSVLGWSALAKHRELSAQVWKTFNIPLARVRIIQLTSGETLLSDISLLPLDTLGAREVAYLEERVRWVS
ncbi:MAG TPA: hypothetical protein VLB27_04525, partial [candidate division Zixibacteria bacterium]|nr:hypothetical protein [candidate division Zixibacteria bacterium]